MSKAILSAIITMNLVLTPPVQAQARLSPPASEEVQEIYDSYPRVRKDETMAEMYYRIETRLSAEDKDHLAKLLNGHGREKAPEVLLEGPSMIIRHAGKELRITTIEKKDTLSIEVNGKILSEEEIADPVLRHKALEKILQANVKEAAGKKGALFFLWSEMFPRAEAFEFNWSTILPILTVGIAVIGGVWLMKRQKKAQEKANASPACSVTTPTCCAVGTGYAVHTNGCCQQIGGLGAGAAASCPLGQSTNPAYSTPSPFGTR